MSEADSKGGDAPKVVDERFWLSRAAKIVEEASDKLDKGCDRVSTAAAWFWGAYSTVLTAALALSPIKVTLGMALVAALPALSLFLAYGFSTWAALPIPLRFNVLMPEEIKRAHEDAIKRKRRRLWGSVAFAALSAILVLVAGLVFALADRKETGDLAIALSNGEIVVGGSIPDDGTVVVRVAPHGAPGAASSVAAKKNEPLRVVVPVASADTYDVEITWEHDKRTMSIRETVKAP